MARKKKKGRSLLWLLVKLPFIGVGKVIAISFKALNKQVEKGFEKRKLRKAPAYSILPKFESFNIEKEISGEFHYTEKRIFSDSLILLIFGKRGSGKSSLGFRLLENIHSKTKRKCYALGIEQKLIPNWISSVDSVEKVPNGGVVLIDEGAISFGSRDSMTIKNKELIKLLAIARHKSLSLVFVTQNTGLIDKNILALTDALFVKEGSLLQMEMERPEVRKFYEKANKSLKEIKENRKGHVYLIDSDFEGTLSYKLPSFWSNDLSKNKAV